MNITHFIRQFAPPRPPAPRRALVWALVSTLLWMLQVGHARADANDDLLRQLCQAAYDAEALTTYREILVAHREKNQALRTQVNAIQREFLPRLREQRHALRELRDFVRSRPDLQQEIQEIRRRRQEANPAAPARAVLEELIKRLERKLGLPWRTVRSSDQGPEFRQVFEGPTEGRVLTHSTKELSELDPLQVTFCTSHTTELLWYRRTSVIQICSTLDLVTGVRRPLCDQCVESALDVAVETHGFLYPPEVAVQNDGLYPMILTPDELVARLDRIFFNDHPSCVDILGPGGRPTSPEATTDEDDDDVPSSAKGLGPSGIPGPLASPAH